MNAHTTSSSVAAGRPAPTHSCDICIVGTGAIGKTAALALAQAGLRVNLLAAPSAPPQGEQASWDVRVYAINQVGQSLLASVKVWDALDAERIAPVTGMDVVGDAESNPGQLSFDAYASRVDALAWIIEDRNLNQALDAALKFAPNVRVIQARAKSLQADPQSAWLQLENGDTLQADLIVGADGAQSWVRGKCDIGLDYRSYGQRAIVSNFACEKPHNGIARQWFTAAEGIVALLPLPGQKVSLVWSAPDALADTLMRQPAAHLAQELARYAEPSLGQLTPLLPELVREFPLRLIKPHAIIAPRVALIGDAAHVVHPLAGHGMNLGFADVAGLLKQIAEREPYRDCGDPKMLRRYARSRKEDILLMQLTTDGLARLFEVDVEPLRAIRNIGLNLVNHLPVLKRRLMAHALGKGA
ncbi:ubiquinone biosynthesis UbiH/UbiF/VisC/COQ6 family hydroxylase [Herbaspirillum sp. Sphag1AN]|uniref:FAD-dependent monooxygenase n=1 Tax=unclassified Herbaspirillum TaxID=2624150 RepID=UPI0016197CE0|nr:MULTISPECIES: FAD-dependent monooxygenase [unclassified Herbaspirillum]MBB3212581.1 ubiquinone biosynthesis UbiH/UbiF/VisC/COQ6 family hydroxylase [Herbaspirillum sp. Sphag1AN]MBB3245778.1 ubiquinone biosynthesis UbiH/UbiF/VisC/COQ6 family hydroxylase [Herbaspirillum sp. Sphag64]